MYTITLCNQKCFSVGHIVYSCWKLYFSLTNQFSISITFFDLGLWTFLWFVGFCYMTDAWRKTPDVAPYLAPGGHGKDHIQAAIAFSFFSIITWASFLIKTSEKDFFFIRVLLKVLLWSCLRNHDEFN